MAHERELVPRRRAQARLQHPPQGLRRPREVDDGDLVDALGVDCAQRGGEVLHGGKVHVQRGPQPRHVRDEGHLAHLGGHLAGGLKGHHELVPHVPQRLLLTPAAEVDHRVPLQVAGDDPHVRAGLAAQRRVECPVFGPHLEGLLEHDDGLLDVPDVGLQHPPGGVQRGPLELRMLVQRGRLRERGPHLLHLLGPPLLNGPQHLVRSHEV
mmetsp:Transcript_73321/g.192244  ORF Transcript_73321/g.192244 Transcript_73321/m.192244 type:complete len:210 (+) Transcript_73321:267-896(+)